MTLWNYLIINKSIIKRYLWQPLKQQKNNNVYVPFGNGDLEISAKEATKNISPEWQPGEYNTFPGKNKLKKIDFIKE